MKVDSFNVSLPIFHEIRVIIFHVLLLNKIIFGVNGLSRILYIYRSSVTLIKLTRCFMKFPYFYPCGGGNTWAGSIRGVSSDPEPINELTVSDSLPFCSQRGEHNIFSLPPPLSLSLSLSVGTKMQLR